MRVFFLIPEVFLYWIGNFVSHPDNVSMKRFRERFLVYNNKGINTWYRWSFPIENRKFCSLWSMQMKMRFLYSNKGYVFLRYQHHYTVRGSWGIRIWKKRQNKKQTIFGIAHRICCSKQRVSSLSEAALINVSWLAKYNKIRIYHIENIYQIVVTQIE